MPRRRDKGDGDDERPAVVPLLFGGSSGTTAATGRHRSLATLSLRGIPKDRLDSFVAALQAQGVRATRDGYRLIVPARDRPAVEGLIDLERLAPAETIRQFDHRWWTGLVDAAIELAEDYDEDEGFRAEVVDRFFEAHERFLHRGLTVDLKPSVHGKLIGLAEAVVRHLRTGRFVYAAETADRLVAATARLR